MADISAYPNILPKAQDLIIGSETYVAGVAEVIGNPTRNFTVGSIVDLANSASLGYTSYVALISQTGTNDPIVTQLANTTNKTFTFTRVSGGSYRITASDSLFTSGKTIVFLNGGAAENNHDVAWLRVSNTIINLETHNSDGKFTNGSLEIRIYN
tara:strand:+ start:1165 stop:1629 length:465 start_codon:yes stop_codon:yes gene_type:complete